ncbi:MAG: Heat shock protein Hsp20 [Parcubacteria group bacterium GW2011_GWF2_38_76]|nr:MAG: Heat shock protein Hsp20 [Parcubacteria group bacterium GW2011_GWF2_38_76]HBM45849.1 Hsp20/alpha crystallin family protein [Patescibacteria group bacterium]
MIWANLNEMDEEVKIKPQAQVAQQTEPQVVKSDWALATDVYNKGRNIVVKLNLAGIDPDKIDISVTSDSVKISGVAEEEETTEGCDYFVKEIRRGSFERVVKFPVRVEMDKAEAEYKNGILKITIPKREESIVNKIKVKAISNQ